MTTTKRYNQMKKTIVLLFAAVMALATLSACSVVEKVVYPEYEYTDSNNGLLMSGIGDSNIELIRESAKDGADLNSAELTSWRDSLKSSPLLFALSNGENTLGCMLELGADVNANNDGITTAIYRHGSPMKFDASGYTALMFAAGVSQNGITDQSYCSLQKVRMLIDAGADVNAQNHNGYMALDCCLEYNYDEHVAKLLMESGSKPTELTLTIVRGLLRFDDTYKRPSTISLPLAQMILKECGHGIKDLSAGEIAENLVLGNVDEAVEEIERKGVDEQDLKGTVLCAVAFGNGDVLDALEARSIKVETIDISGYDLISVAAQCGNIDVIEYLLDKGMSINGSGDSYSPLSSAIFNNEYETAQLLLSRGAIVSHNEAEDDLLRATYTDEKMLDLVYKSDAWEMDVIGMALQNAARIKNRNTFDYLYDNCVHKRKVYMDEMFVYVYLTPNLYDSYSYYVEKFIADGVNVTDKTYSVDRIYAPPLCTIVEGGSFENTKLLVQAGADVNEADPSGYTPLYYAVEHGYYDIVKYLLEQGADINETVDGDTIIEFAEPTKDVPMSQNVYECIRGYSK
jgi:ankyrin repeat protein